MKQFALIVIVGAMAGCSTSNIQIGDSDYPVNNANPKKILSIKGDIPSTLDVKLIAHYSPKDGGIYNPTTGGLVCGYMVGLGAYAPYMVDVPLHISRNGTTYVSSIPIDQFQEGRCGWHLFSLTYSVSKDKLATRASYNMDLLRALVDQSSGNYHGGENNPNKLYKWCFASSNDVDKTYLDCEPSIDNKLFEFVPDEKKNFYSQSIIDLETQAVEINFYDLDAMAVHQ